LYFHKINQYYHLFFNTTKTETTSGCIRFCRTKLTENVSLRRACLRGCLKKSCNSLPKNSKEFFLCKGTYFRKELKKCETNFNNNKKMKSACVIGSIKEKCSFKNIRQQRTCLKYFNRKKKYFKSKC